MTEPVQAPGLSTRTRNHALLAVAACLLPLLLQLPATLGIGFGLTAVLVGAAAWRRPLPALLRLLLTAASLLGVVAVAPGIGRDTACAVLAAMLAVKPAETRNLRDGRSLVGFGLFAPFATFLLDQGPLSLTLALIAVLLSVLALQRLAADEGDIREPATAPPWQWHAMRSVLRLFALGLPLTLATFWLFPRLATPLWGLPERALAKPGLSDSMSPGSMSLLLNDDSPAALVQFFGAAPRPEQLYWRGPTLWDFDGQSWQQAHDLQRIAAPAPPANTAGWDYRLDLEPTESRQLIALDLPTQAPAGTRISFDHTLWADTAQYSVSRWRLHSAPASAFARSLPAALRRRALALPAGFNPRTLALGKRWRRMAAHDDEAIVQRALSMIHREFAYTLNVPLAGRNEVDDFLFTRKSGYCEHFSSAFVVLMRAAGIPARVVTGYAGGYHNPVGNYWLIRKSDAHAWAEVWLAKHGWVRIDPTAAVAPERVYDTLADRQPGRIGGLGVLVPVFNAGDWLRRGWNDFVLGFNAQRQRSLLKPLGVDALQPRDLILMFAALAGAALAWMAWLVSRGERQRDPLLRAWHALDVRYHKLGKGRQLHEPALAWASRVAADTPYAGLHLLELAQRFCDARYANTDQSPKQRQLIRELRRHRP